GPFAYVQTWEQHRTGAPHVNVLIGNEALSMAALDDWKAVRRHWLKPNAVGCGFGPVLWVEPMRSAGAMAGYLVKLARELTGAEHKGQTPVDAPRNFRRLRASHGLLPPPYKDESLTGILHKCPVQKNADL